MLLLRFLSQRTRQEWVLIIAMFLIASWISFNRVLQVDECQNVYSLWILGTGRLAHYDFYCPLYLLPMVPLVKWAGSAATLYLAVRGLWILLFLVICFGVVHLGGFSWRDRSYGTGLLAVALTAPLWTYGLEVRHDAVAAAMLLLVWFFLAPSSKPVWGAYTWVGFVVGCLAFVINKHLLATTPFLLFAVLYPHPAHGMTPRWKLLVQLILGLLAALAFVAGSFATFGALGVMLHAYRDALATMQHIDRFSPMALLGTLALQAPFMMALLCIQGVALAKRGRTILWAVAWEDGSVAFAWWGLHFFAALINPSPFPYNALVLVALGWVAALRPLKRLLEILAPAPLGVHLVTSLLAFTLGVPWLLKADRSFGWSNDSQLELMRTAEALTDPEKDRVFDACGLVPSRESMAPIWFVHFMNARGLAAGGTHNLYARMVEKPPAVIIPNYRFTYLDTRVTTFIQKHYVPYGQNQLYVPGVSADSKEILWTCILTGRYMVRVKGSSTATLDGHPLTPGVASFDLGAHTLQVPAGVNCVISWLGPQAREVPLMTKMNAPLFPIPIQW